MNLVGMFDSRCMSRFAIAIKVRELGSEHEPIPVPSRFHVPWVVSLSGPLP